MKFLKTLSVSLLLIFSVLFTPLVGSTVLAADPVVGVSYQTHVQNVGWQTTVVDGALSGTEGQSLRLEAIKVQLLNAPVGAKISYKVHVQNIGWQSYFSDSAVAGTSGLSLRLEAIQIKLEGMPGYSVQYQVHVQNVGWQDWKADDVVAGTSGQSLRLEAIRIKIVKLPETATTELAKITNTVVGTLPFGTADAQFSATTPPTTGVEDAMLVLARAVVSPNYNVTIAAGSTYSPVTNLWVGKFVVTSKTLGINDMKTDADYRGIVIAFATSTEGAVNKLSLITDAGVQTLPYTVANTQAAVEAAMLVKAQALVDGVVASEYTVSIAAGSAYSPVTKAWVGKFTVTNNTTPADTATHLSFRMFIVSIGSDASIGAAAELAKITNAVIGTLPFGTYADVDTVQVAIKSLAEAAIDSTKYAVSFELGNTYSTATKLWVGKLIVTNKGVAADTKKDADYRGIVLAIGPNTQPAKTALVNLVNPATVPFGTANTQAVVEAAMLKIANTSNLDYAFSIEAGSTYNTAAKAWLGKFRATSKTLPGVTAADGGFRSFTVTIAAQLDAGAIAELAKVTNAVVGTVPLATGVGSTAVTDAMLVLANAAVNTTAGYSVSLVDGWTYSTVTKLFTGKFKVSQTVGTVVSVNNVATDANYRGIVIAVEADNTGAVDELGKITVANSKLTTTTALVPFGTAKTQAAVEAALLNIANTRVLNTYYVTVAPGATYSTLSNVWIGQFKVTNIATPANTETSAILTIAVTPDADYTALAAELAKVTNAVVGTLDFGTDLTSKTIVDATMLALADAAVNHAAGYHASIASSSYIPEINLWAGKFTVTQTTTTPTLTLTDTNIRTITVVVAPDLTGAGTKLAHFVSNHLSAVQALNLGTANNQTAVEAAMLIEANKLVASGYVVSIAAGSSYNLLAKVWTGRFVVTSTTNAANTATEILFRNLNITFDKVPA